MAIQLSVSQRIRRKAPRLVKHLRQRAHVIVHGYPETKVLFVVGSQRSGTRLPLQMLDQAREVMTYNEGSAPYFQGVLLKPLAEVARLVRASPFPIVVLKPICEMHRLSELLQYFPDSRAIWIFRSYADVVRSATAKWRSGREAVRRLAEGDLERAGWRAGGLSAEKLQLVRGLYRDGLSLDGANALMWYLRNDLYFDLGIYERHDVLLVRYEDLVAGLRRPLERLCAFSGVRAADGLSRAVRRSAKGQSTADIPDAIERLCAALEARLKAHYDRALAT